MCNRHSHKLCPSCSFVFSAVDNAIVSCPFHTVVSRTFPFCSILWPCANVKVKCSLVYPRKGREGSEMGSRYSLSFCNLGASWGWVVNATPQPQLPLERDRRGWVGSRAGLDGCGKSWARPGLDPRTIEPVASRCTEYSIQTYCVRKYIFIKHQSLLKSIKDRTRFGGSKYVSNGVNVLVESLRRYSD